MTPLLRTALLAALATHPPTPAADLSDDQWADVPPPPGERYYLLAFGSQATPKRPKYTHTRATVVRASGDADLDCHTISWLPATEDSRYPVRRFMQSPVLIDPPKTHDWVLDRLDVGPVERKAYRGRAVPYVPVGPDGPRPLGPFGRGDDRPQSPRQ